VAGLFAAILALSRIQGLYAVAAASSQQHAGTHADAPRWTRNPAWALFSQTHAQRQLLLVSGGADELYVVDEADTPTAVERMLGHWQDDTLAILQDDADCGSAVRQLIRLGVLVPLQAVPTVRRYALDWLGDPLPGLADAFDQQGGAALQRVDAVADADLLDAGVIFGTGFAPFRGGPIQYIRATGADALVERLKVLQQRHGDRFAPRPGWDDAVLREPAV